LFSFPLYLSNRNNYLFFAFLLYIVNLIKIILLGNCIYCFQRREHFIKCEIETILEHLKVHNFTNKCKIYIMWWLEC